MYDFAHVICLFIGIHSVFHDLGRVFFNLFHFLEKLLIFLKNYVLLHILRLVCDTKDVTCLTERGNKMRETKCQAVNISHFPFLSFPSVFPTR